MAREGLIALLCAGLLLAAGPRDSSAAPPPGDRESAVNDTLAVQTALQQAKELLYHNQFRTAVQILEGQLAKINGNRTYLNTLQEAYRGCIKELRLAKNDAEAQKYLDRLRILDPGAVLDKSLSTSSSPPVPAAMAAGVPAPSKPAPLARAKIDEDPFRAEQRDDKRGGEARRLLEQAEKEFGNRHYREARMLYQQAHAADQNITDPCRERWAYCRLYYVVEQMNQMPAGDPRWRDLEKEVRQVLDQAPRLDYANYLLGELQKRSSVTEARVPVQHRDRGGDGWAVTESQNFRIFHNQNRDFAEQAARVAERTRTEMSQRWFGGAGEDWNPKCELYLHATGNDYSRATSVPATSPGHSSIKSENGRITGRRIDLHCDDPNLLYAVLPHEATHVVLAGQFGEHPVPRWADEGMAVLSEPREKVERHLRNLAKCRQEGQVFSLRHLMQLSDYPDPRSIGAFYAQSVSLVEFLSNERGPQVFTQFLRDGLRTGYDAALQRHYGWQGFGDLEQRWSSYVARSGANPTAVAERAR